MQVICYDEIRYAIPIYHFFRTESPFTKLHMILLSQFIGTSTNRKTWDNRSVKCQNLALHSFKCEIWSEFLLSTCQRTLFCRKQLFFRKLAQLEKSYELSSVRDSESLLSCYWICMKRTSIFSIDFNEFYKIAFPWSLYMQKFLWTAINNLQLMCFYYNQKTKMQKF